MGQQHGFGKTAKVQPRDFGDAFGFFFEVGSEDGPLTGICMNLRQLYLGGLQGTIDFVACAALAPKGAVGGALHFKLHLGQAVAGVAGHQVVAGGAQAAQARRLVVQRQADGIEQRRFACARRAGDGKQAGVGKWRLAKIYRPLAFECVQVFQAQAQNFHAASPACS